QPRAVTAAPRARLRVSRTTDTKETAMAAAAQASARSSLPAMTAPTPAGRNHVHRRAVPPNTAASATSAPLQNASLVVCPVGAAVVSSAPATPAAPTATPKLIVRERRVANSVGRRTAIDMGFDNLGDPGTGHPVGRRGRHQ